MELNMLASIMKPSKKTISFIFSQQLHKKIGATLPHGRVTPSSRCDNFTSNLPVCQASKKDLASQEIFHKNKISFLLILH